MFSGPLGLTDEFLRWEATPMSDKSEPFSLELITGIMNDLAQLVDDKKLT